MFCPHCGAQAVETSDICQACGQELLGLSGEMEAQAVGSGAAENCLQCGAPLGLDELFCGQCGTRASGHPQDELSLDAHPIGRGNRLLRRAQGHQASADADDLKRYWHDTLSVEYDAPTEAYHRPQLAPSALRSPSGSSLGQGTLSHPISSTYLVSGKSYLEPPVRSHVALVIGLLCFLASFISGSAAIWLAVTTLH